MHSSFGVKTGRRVQMVDITAQVAEAATKSGVGQGLCVVFVPHTTAGITINENADPAVASDIEGALGRLIPANDGYRHAEGNSDSHLKATLTGFSQTLIIDEGRLVLGTWQGVYFCEYDGPRSRRVHVKVIPG